MEDEADSLLNEISQVASNIMGAQERLNNLTEISSRLQDEMALLTAAVNYQRLNISNVLRELGVLALENDKDTTLIQLTERVCETDDSENCVICLEEPKRGQLVKELPCSHFCCICCHGYDVIPKLFTDQSIYL
uniref:RING-type domain-containing protein n=1 Tax=Strigamia maritima TaxID=126957 RepID=T1J724_STRMM